MSMSTTVISTSGLPIDALAMFRYHYQPAIHTIHLDARAIMQRAHLVPGSQSYRFAHDSCNGTMLDLLMVHYAGSGWSGVVYQKLMTQFIPRSGMQASHLPRHAPGACRPRSWRSRLQVTCFDTRPTSATRYNFSRASRVCPSSLGLCCSSMSGSDFLTSISIISCCSLTLIKQASCINMCPVLWPCMVPRTQHRARLQISRVTSYNISCVL